jgi:ATP-dependent Zn protease
MNTKTKKLIFFAVLICVAITLALVVGDRRYETRMTYSEFLRQVQSGEVAKATISVAQTGANPVMYILKNGARMQTIVPRDYNDALATMQSKLVNIEIRDSASQRWLALENSIPFFLLLGFWFFMMWQLKKKPRLLG